MTQQLIQNSFLKEELCNILSILSPDPVYIQENAVSFLLKVIKCIKFFLLMIGSLGKPLPFVALFIG